MKELIQMLLSDYMFNEKFMKDAIEDARIGLDYKTGGPFGCVIVRNNRIVGRGHNTVLQDTNPTHHAEINAISEACKKLKTIDLSECILYSTVEPCPMCLSAIHWAKIKTVVYGAEIKDAKKYGFNEIHLSDKAFNRTAGLKIKFISGVMLNETKELFEIFKKKNIKTY